MRLSTLFTTTSMSVVIGGAVLALGLTGCSSSSDSSASAPAVSAAASSSTAVEAVVIEDPTVRATDDISPVSKDSGKLMTGAFMTITNNGDTDVALVGGSSPVAGKVEIHEVLDGNMVPKAGGVTIHAQGSQVFRMGGYHVMLMELDGPLSPGDEVPLTLQFSDGTTADVTASVRAIAMDDEKYGPDMAATVDPESLPHTHESASAPASSME